MKKKLFSKQNLFIKMVVKFNKGREQGTATSLIHPNRCYLPLGRGLHSVAGVSAEWTEPSAPGIRRQSSPLQSICFFLHLYPAFLEPIS